MQPLYNTQYGLVNVYINFECHFRLIYLLCLFLYKHDKVINLQFDSEIMCLILQMALNLQTAFKSHCNIS